ncbi:hypothetical protein O9G_001521 [Rozella allomycis CSF55]|uniref:Uncharacterized protein n=1 Tax=Rozella allomycis (strain CSF55) TaxID=988480 RepID=A0A075B2E2_ROZAC|nr:hypothetical protein O9G_001521 [Rozella allomycis CSF55]|eukprot:EPZ36537.1 hypothetical protein O9G_001521 [Rozella allomycis CSF55]
MNTSWDSIRKETRMVELAIDNQISKITSLMATDLSGTDSLAQEIISNLSNLNNQIAKMNQYIESLPVENTILLKTLQRHKDGAFNYEKEFRRIQDVLRQKKEEQELLKSYNK